MKKSIALGLGVAVCLSLSACGKKPATTERTIEMPKGGLTVEDNNTLSGWLAKGKPVECKISGPEGQMSVLVKGETVRIEGIPYFSADFSGSQPQAANGVILSLGGVNYMWDKVTKKGSKMSSPDASADNQAEKNTAELSGSENDWRKMVGEWEAAGYQYECEEADMSDDLFTVPSDVEFTDFDILLQNMQKNIDGLASSTTPAETTSGTPAAETAPATKSLNQEDIEKMMEEKGIDPSQVPAAIQE